MTKVMAAHAAIIVCICILVIFTVFIFGNAQDEIRETTLQKVAHRGGAALAPENTLAAFQRGIEANADVLEMDIHLSSDGVIMVMHDPLLKRTTGHAGEIADYTLLELKQFDAALFSVDRALYAFQPIPTLEDVLKLIQKEQRTVGLQIEIKLKANESRYEGIERHLIDLLRTYDMIDRTIVISFDFPTLQDIRMLEPAMKRGALISKKYMTSSTRQGNAFIASDIKGLHVEYVGINYNYLSAKLYQAFRAEKLGVGVWTVNDAATMKKMLAMGVDFITTDDPDLLAKELGS